MSVTILTRMASCACGVVVMSVAAVGAGHVGTAAAMARANAAPGQARIATAPGPAAGRVLGGQTAQHWPVTVTLSANGKRLAAQVALDMHCTSGNTWTSPDGWKGVPVSAAGLVRASAAIPPSPGTATADAISGGQDTMTGKLNRKQAVFSGVWELQLNFTSPTGQSDSCDSGRVPFSVRL